MSTIRRSYMRNCMTNCVNDEIHLPGERTMKMRPLPGRNRMQWRMVYVSLLLIFSTPFAGSGASFDWPQWQGPERNAISAERGLLKQWPKEGPPLAWKVKGLGGGYSGPSI